MGHTDTREAARLRCVSAMPLSMGEGGAVGDGIRPVAAITLTSARHFVHRNNLQTRHRSRVLHSRMALHSLCCTLLRRATARR